MCYESKLAPTHGIFGFPSSPSPMPANICFEKTMTDKDEDKNEREHEIKTTDHNEAVPACLWRAPSDHSSLFLEMHQFGLCFLDRNYATIMFAPR